MMLRALERQATAILLIMAHCDRVLELQIEAALDV